MKIDKKITITLTPAEVKDILLEHINKNHSDFLMTDVCFDVTTVYNDNDSYDQGTKKLTTVSVLGNLK